LSDRESESKSESKSTNPTERIGRPLPHPHPFPENERYFEAGELAEDEAPFPREGLPQGYRMRHEGHYVDELIAAGSMPRLRLLPVNQIESGAPAEPDSIESLASLVDSIQEFGVLQPLLVRRDRGRYELLSGAKRLVAAVSAGLTEVPCLVLEVDDVEARRLAEAANRGAGPKSPFPMSKLPWTASATSLIEGSLHCILSTLGLLEKPESSLRDQVALGLIRAEALRASRLMHGLRILNADPPVLRRQVDVNALVQDVLGESEDERALLAVELGLTADESCSIRADRELLALAVSGAVETVLSLLRKSRGAKLAVRLVKNPLSRALSLFVSEDAVRMPTASWSRWFDGSWEARPGGHAAAIALFAARRAAELHGGRVEIAPTEAGGVRLSLIVPEA
jgi:ParB-like chromosome segregation protein Spo0J